MKVKELIKELKKFDGNLDVVFDDQDTLLEYGCIGFTKVQQVAIFESPEYAGGNEEHGGVTLS